MASSFSARERPLSDLVFGIRASRPPILYAKRQVETAKEVVEAVKQYIDHIIA